MDTFKIWNLVFNMTPIFAVIVAGFFAIHRMRENVKMEARLKWKEEFRSKIVEFLHAISTVNNKAIFYDIEKENNDSHKRTDEYLELTYKLHSIYYSIDLMLNSDDIRAVAMHEAYKSILDEIHEVLMDNDAKKNEEDYVSDFYELAKQIYNDDKTIDKLI